MAIDVSPYIGNTITPFDFAQPQVCEVPIPNSRNVLVIYTGTALMTVPGSGAEWRRSIVEFNVPTVNGRRWTSLRSRGPGWTLVRPNALNSPIPNSASTASLASISNRNEANNAGWAVDAAWTEIILDEGEFAPPSDRLRFRALVAVRDSDGFILRLAYQATLLGENL